jgi:hypothetical protein
VMEYLEGTDLDALVEARGPLTVDRALELVQQACEALAEAHRAGIIHRDIKPENLFLCRDGEGPEIVKIVDFGLAKRIDAAASKVLTGPQDAMGSPCYMSPEQVVSPHEVDARTDVWSMGVVLYRILSGALPFDGDTLTEVCARVLHAPPLPLHQVRRGLDRKIDRLVMRCLMKDPASRYQSISELAIAIARYRGLKTSDTQPVPPGRRALGRPAHPRAGVFGALALLVGLAAFGLHRAERAGRLDLAALRTTVVGARLDAESAQAPSSGAGVHAFTTPPTGGAAFDFAEPPRVVAKSTDGDGEKSGAATEDAHKVEAKAFDDAAIRSFTDTEPDAEPAPPDPEAVADPAPVSEPEAPIAAQPDGPVAVVPELAEPALSPEEVERRKHAYSAFLKENGFVPLRDALRDLGQN